MYVNLVASFAMLDNHGLLDFTEIVSMHYDLRFYTMTEIHFSRSINQHIQTKMFSQDYACVPE